MPFTIQRLAISDVVRIEPKIYQDERGAFVETFKCSEFSSLGLPDRFVQDNHSRSIKNVVRGLHYQLHPKAQGKLIRCCRGAIFDVCVDIRKGSPTYGNWIGIELSDENHRLLYIPPGFAHGFTALTEAVDVVYKCTEEFSPAHERGIRWNDPAIGIQWQTTEPIVSRKDRELPLLADAESNFVYEG